MASEVGICNRALTKLGAKRIVSLTDDSVNARECNNAYAEVRDTELRRHKWRFAMQRTTLAASTTAPAFDYAYAFPLPADCLRVHLPNDNDLDWQVEGRSILSNDNVLYVRYTRQVTDPNDMDVAFREALACKLALDICEKITQSNTKMAALKQEYKDAIAEARRANAFETVAEEGREDTWITARL